MNIPFVDLKAQYRSIREEIDTAIASVIEETAFIGGKYVKSFEEEFAAYLGVKHCICVGNGTDALAIALRGLGLDPGDEVVVPANTFIGTAEAVTLAGGKPVFADCDPLTYTITPETAEKALTPKTRGILPVHLYGNPAPVGELKELADRKGLFLLEDAAQAHGAAYKGKMIGSFGHAAAFSFYPGKNLGAYGDGGCITTNDGDLATRIRMYANHGRLKKYDHEFEGTNSRLDGIQAAILSVKLKHLENWTEKRRTIARLYDEKLVGLPLVTPHETPGGRHVYHLYVIRLQDRENVKDILSQEGILTGVHYPEALPNLTAYRHLGHQAEDFPSASRCSKEVLSLPIFPEMTLEQVEAVCEALKKALSKA
jgi:dTDP-4-amino-4,6-dideoxygalactose transaminase